MSKSIEAICDATKVELKMFGSPAVIIERPGTVSVDEWLEFWGWKPPVAVHTGSRFSKEDVEGNNTRRGAFMEEEALRHEREGRN